MLLKKMFLQNKLLIIGVVVVVVLAGGYVYNQNKQKALVYEVIPGRPPELPKLAPVNFPVYPESEVIRMESQPPVDFAVGFASQDKPAQIYQYLLENAAKNGWQITQQSGLIFRAVKDKTTVTISISQKPGEQTAILEQVKF